MTPTSRSALIVAVAGSRPAASPQFAEAEANPVERSGLDLGERQPILARRPRPKCPDR